LTPRICLTRREAAASIGLGLTAFETRIQPHLKVVRVGAKVLVPVSELERYVAENATHTLERAR
jgi:hypothetical protein